MCKKVSEIAIASLKDSCLSTFHENEKTVFKRLLSILCTRCRNTSLHGAECGRWAMVMGDSNDFNFFRYVKCAKQMKKKTKGRDSRDWVGRKCHCRSSGTQVSLSGSLDFCSASLPCLPSRRGRHTRSIHTLLRLEPMHQNIKA